MGEGLGERGATQHHCQCVRFFTLSLYPSPIKGEGYNLDIRFRGRDDLHGFNFFAKIDVRNASSTDSERANEKADSLFVHYFHG